MRRPGDGAPDTSITRNRQFGVAGRHGKLQRRNAGAVQLKGDFARLADFDGGAAHALAGHAHGQFGHLARRAGIVHQHGNAQPVADDTVGGRLFDHQPPVALIALAGQQHVHRAGIGHRVRHLGRVVDLAVGDQDGAGDPIGGHVGQGLGEGREQKAAVGAGIGGDGHDAEFEIVHRVQSRAHGVGRLGRLGAARADVLAGGRIDHQGDDIRQGFAPLVDQGRVEQGQQTRRQHHGPPRHATRARPRAVSHHGGRQRRQRGQQRDRQKRRERESRQALHLS